MNKVRWFYPAETDSPFPTKDYKFHKRDGWERLAHKLIGFRMKPPLMEVSLNHKSLTCKT